MNRRQMLVTMGLLPLAGAAVPVARHLEERSQQQRSRAGDGFHGGHFPNLVLRTQEGERVRLYDDLLRGKTVVVHFFYTLGEDAYCASTTQNLRELQRLLGSRCGRDVHLYSFSLTPAHDKPARLKRFQATHQAGPGWTFLTGSPRDLERCRLCFGIADPEPARDRQRASHTGVVLLGHEPNERWMAWPALTPPEALLDQLDRVAGLKS